MKGTLLKTALVTCAILVALVGTATAADLLDPDATCRWIYIGGQWILICF